MNTKLKRMSESIISLKLTKPILSTLFRRKAIIFMGHRISEFSNKNLKPNENMKVSPKFIESFIIDCNNKGFEFISLDSLVERLISKSDLSKKIVLTFDDGYKDNILNGYPIFKKYGIPFTIYLSTSFIDNSEIPWWYKLELIILQNDEVYWQGKKIILHKTEEKNVSFMQIRNELLNMSKYRFTEELLNFISNSKFQTSIEPNLFLSWADLRALNNDVLVSLQNHGHKHCNLIKLSPTEIINEYLTSQKRILEETGKKSNHISFPFGLYNNFVMKSISNLEITTATTTKAGIISHSDQKNIMQLPRFPLIENVYIDEVFTKIAFQTRFGIKRNLIDE